MDPERRRYVIAEHLLKNRTYKEIASDLDITPLALYRDRHRHRAEWDIEETWFGLKNRWRDTLSSEDLIEPTRQLFVKIQAVRANYRSEWEVYRAKHPNMTQEDFSAFAQMQQDFETWLVQIEIEVCVNLSQGLAEKYNFSDSV